MVVNNYFNDYQDAIGLTCLTNINGEIEHQYPAMLGAMSYGVEQYELQEDINGDIVSVNTWEVLYISFYIISPC